MIDRLWPEPHSDLDDDRLLEAYAFPDAGSWLRMNYVASVDGAAALDRVAEVVLVGEERTDLTALRADLVARGLARIHSEGGPSLFGDAIEAGIVDELCLTLAPTLEGGPAHRIARRRPRSPCGSSACCVRATSCCSGTRLGVRRVACASVTGLRDSAPIEEVTRR